MEPLIFKTIVNRTPTYGGIVVFYHMSDGRLYRWLNHEDPDNGLRWTQVRQINVFDTDIDVSNKLEFLVVTGVGWMKAMELLRWAKLIHIFEGRDMETNEA